MFTFLNRQMTVRGQPESQGVELRTSKYNASFCNNCYVFLFIWTQLGLHMFYSSYYHALIFCYAGLQISPKPTLSEFRRHVLTAHWIPFTTLKYCQVLTRSGCTRAKSDSNQLSCLENICSNKCLYISIREELPGRCPGRAEARINVCQTLRKQGKCVFTFLQLESTTVFSNLQFSL